MKHILEIQLLKRLSQREKTNVKIEAQKYGIANRVTRAGV